jgi:hypothetical protein
MKNILFLMLPLFFIASCDSDDPDVSYGEVSIIFKGFYGNQPLVLYDFHDYVGPQELSISRSDIFFSHIKLFNDTEPNEYHSELELVKFTDDPSDYTIALDSIKAGTYSKLRLNYGIPDYLNIMVPSDFTSDHSLSKTEYHWTAWESYIFSKYEGQLRTDTADIGYLIHNGLDELYREMVFDIALEVTESGPNEIIIEVDHENMIRNGTDYVDLQLKPRNHDPNDLSNNIFVADNIQSSMSIQ